MSAYTVDEAMRHAMGMQDLIRLVPGAFVRYQYGREGDRYAASDHVLDVVGLEAIDHVRSADVDYTDVVLCDSDGGMYSWIPEAGARYGCYFEDSDRGLGANICTTRRRARLVPERNAKWKPSAGVRYVVSLVRQIGMGRTPVWVCRPLDPKRDERHAAVSSELNNLYSKIDLEVVEFENAQWCVMADYVKGLGIQPRFFRPNRTNIPEDIVWSGWKGEVEEEDETIFYRSSCTRTEERRAVSGTKKATWQGEEGTYRVVEHESRRGHTYESDDGAERTVRYWSRRRESDTSFVSGVDVVAKVEQALKAQKREYEDWSKTRGKAERAAAEILKTLDIPRPAGLSFDPDRDLLCLVTELLIQDE